MRLVSRRNNSFNRRYPLIVEALSNLPEDTVVDGEVVALDESDFPNFSLLQNYRSEAVSRGSKGLSESEKTAL